MLRAFIIGTIGNILRILFLLIGGYLMLMGVLGSSGSYVIVGVIFLCMSASIKYALGIIVRGR